MAIHQNTISPVAHDKHDRDRTLLSGDNSELIHTDMLRSADNSSRDNDTFIALYGMYSACMITWHTDAKDELMEAPKYTSDSIDMASCKVGRGVIQGIHAQVHRF